MGPPTQPAPATVFVRGSSASASEQSLRAVARRMRRWNRWLNEDHAYRDVVAALNQTGTPIDGPKLGEYVAASAPLHLTDGWNYLSRAFDSIARGDRYSAYHLAYYAELRAAMALLATEGIGVFNARHIALDANFVPEEFGGTTHMATWQVLEAWSREPSRGARMLDSIVLDARPLSEWLQAAGVSEPIRDVVAEAWLQAWSVDLAFFSGDRTRRNELSYRPTRMHEPVVAVDPIEEMVSPLMDAWTALEPPSSSSGAALDASLLREALRLAVERGLSTHKTLDDAVESLRGDMSYPLYLAVSSDVPSAVAIFASARAQDAPGRAATPVLARALLMLRLASASVAGLLSAAAVTKQDLAFWWESFGNDLGLWASPAEIEMFSDLWVDVAEAIYEAETDVLAIDDPASVHAVSGILSRELPLTQFSRAPMWLLGLD